MKKMTRTFSHSQINLFGMTHIDDYRDSDSSSTLYDNHHWKDKKQFFNKEPLEEFDFSKYQSRANPKRYQADKILSKMSIDVPDMYINKLKHQKENDNRKMFEERKVNIPSTPPKEQINSLYEELKEIKEKLDILNKETIERQQMLEQELIETKEEFNKLKIEAQALRNENEMWKNLKRNEDFEKEKPKYKKNRPKRPNRIRNEYDYETSSDSGPSFDSGISERRSIKSLHEYKNDEFISYFVIKYYCIAKNQQKSSSLSKLRAANFSNFKFSTEKFKY